MKLLQSSHLHYLVQYRYFRTEVFGGVDGHVLFEDLLLGLREQLADLFYPERFLCSVVFDVEGVVHSQHLALRVRISIEVRFWNCQRHRFLHEHDGGVVHVKIFTEVGEEPGE